MTEKTPALYILMRNDMDSMNNGKSTAHGGHAASVFAKFYYENPSAVGHRDAAGFEAWHMETDF